MLSRRGICHLYRLRSHSVTYCVIHTRTTHTHARTQTHDSHKLHAFQYQLAYMSMCSEALDIVCGPAGSFIVCIYVCVCMCVRTLLGSNTNPQPASML